MSAPGLSWDGMLKKTEIEPELILDPDMYVFFEFLEKGIGGANRYSKAKNNYLKSFGPGQESKHVIYLDANLDGYAMSKFLSTSRFK